jgi:hypothetical protein
MQHRYRNSHGRSNLNGLYLTGRKIINLHDRLPEAAAWSQQQSLQLQHKSTSATKRPPLEFLAIDPEIRVRFFGVTRFSEKQ